MSDKLKFLKENNRKSIAVTMAMIISLFLLFVLYNNVLLNPNDYLFTDWGDGIKNYYTYAWHISHDTSYINFEGMNYPYGEVHQFTDGQPLISNIVKAGGEIIPALDNYSFGILNLFMLLSFVLGSMVLAAIMWEFGIPSYFSAFAAVAIITLSPQIYRFGGHLSLSYYFAIPLAWYLIHMFFKDYRIKYSIGLFLLNLGLFFFHPYLPIICVSFIISYSIIHFISKKSGKLSNIIQLFIQTFLPVILWAIFISSVDHHTNRPEQVFSYESVATLKGLFLPSSGIINSFLTNILGYFPDILWESLSYIGLFSIIILIVLIVKIFGNLLQRKSISKITNKIPAKLWISLIAAGLVLFFALGIPYKAGLDNIFKWIPELQQVRVLARFSWVFFYVVNVFAFVFIYKYLSKSKYPIFRKLLLIGVIAFVFIEGLPSHKSLAKNLSANQFTSGSERYEIPKPEKYQAILPLPYYHVGSHTYRLLHEDERGLEESTLLSYKTGLPLMSSNLSRTSSVEAKSLLKLFIPPYEKKSILKKLDPRPILIMVTDSTKLRDKEKWIIERSRLLHHSNNYSLYSIYPEQFKKFKLADFHPDILKNKEKIDSSGNNFITNNENSDFYFDNYSSDFPQSRMDTIHSYNSKGQKYITIAEFPDTMFQKDSFYEISFWYYNKGKNRITNHFFISVTDNQGDVNWKNYFSLRNGIHYKSWSLITKKFRIKTDIDTIKFVLLDNKGNEAKIYYNDILIRKASQNIYSRMNDSIVFKNNYRVPSAD